MAPGGAATLDHARLAPHAPGKIVKLQFRSVVSGLGATSAAQSFDLSTRCDTAAYALILTGTGAREDRYDPMVFGVAGAEEGSVSPELPSTTRRLSTTSPRRVTAGAPAFSLSKCGADALAVRTSDPGLPTMRTSLTSKLLSSSCERTTWVPSPM